MEYKHKLGTKGKIESNPKIVGQRMKEAICDEFGQRVEKNTLCKPCK